eukprot:jgi/Antlo1/799/207
MCRPACLLFLCTTSGKRLFVALCGSAAHSQLFLESRPSLSTLHVLFLSPTFAACFLHTLATLVNHSIVWAPVHLLALHAHVHHARCTHRRLCGKEDAACRVFLEGLSCTCVAAQKCQDFCKNV